MHICHGQTKHMGAKEPYQRLHWFPITCQIYDIKTSSSETFLSKNTMSNATRYRVARIRIDNIRSHASRGLLSKLDRTLGNDKLVMPKFIYLWHFYFMSCGLRGSRTIQCWTLVLCGLESPRDQDWRRAFITAQEALQKNGMY